MADIDKLVKAFQTFDTDGSGTLSASEMVAILTRPGSSALSEEDSQAFINLFDKDGDGQLDLGEFVVAMLALNGAAPPSEDEGKPVDPIAASGAAFCTAFLKLTPQLAKVRTHEGSRTVPARTLYTRFTVSAARYVHCRYPDRTCSSWSRWGRRRQ